MLVEFTTTLSPLTLWVRIAPGRGVLDTTLCELCQWLTIGQWFSPSTPVSSTNNTDRHNITEILLKVVFNIVNKTKRKVIFLVIQKTHINAILFVYISIIQILTWLWLFLGHWCYLLKQRTVAPLILQTLAILN